MFATQPSELDPLDSEAAPAMRPTARIGSPEALVATFLLGILGALFVWWAWKQGAYFGSVFYPGALVVFLLIALVLALAPFPGRLSGPVKVALGGAFALAAWTLLSILWTPVRAAAIADAERAFLYAVVFLAGLWVACLLGRNMRWALAPLALTGSLVGVATVITIATGSDFNWYLQDDATLRLPMGYRNANAAFFLICLWPLVGLATSNDGRWQLRALAVAAGTMLLELAILAQSRGSIPAAAVALLVYLAFTPNRLRAASVIGLVALPVLPALPALLDVYRHGQPDVGVLPILHHAAQAVGMTSILSLLLASIAFRVIYPRLRLGASGVRLISWVTAVAAISLVMAGGSIFVAKHGGPIKFLDQRASEFGKVGYPDLRGQGVRFGVNVGSNRHDFWRVGLDQVVAQPLLGGGAGSFQLAYLKHRKSPESPRDPHSIEVRILGELGVPGFLALIAFIGGAWLAAWRARRLAPVVAAVVAPAVAGSAQWLVHGFYDWFWLYPGITAPGIYLLGVAAAPTVSAAKMSRDSTRLRIFAAGALAVLALLVVPLFFSDSYRQRALGESRNDPAQALRDLKRAADLNPFDSQPLLERGALASSLGQRAIALESFRQAATREPDDYAVHWFLARALLSTNPPAAKAELAQARQLNPRGPEIATLQRMLKTQAREGP